MDSFRLVVRQIAVWIGQFLAWCGQSWLTTILLFLLVLSGIVSTILSVRGGKN